MMARAFTFALQREDPLGVLGSCAPVVEGAAHVRIDADAVVRFADAHEGRPAPVLAEDTLHCTFLPPRRRLNYLLALEALNFCFWDDEPRWRVAYEGRRYDGYWALAAALHRAVREDALPVWDAHWLARLDGGALAHLLRGEGRPPPLPEARLAHLREAGTVLLSRWGGQFANVVASCEGDAVRMVETIAAEFPSFRDEAQWRGRPVRFHKRAQICVADLARLMPDDPLGHVETLEPLTAFADYKLPQVLRKEGILVFSDELAARVARGEALPAGGEAEVELRAATVWACEWIARALNRRRAAGLPAVTAVEVDSLLWAAGQHKAGLPPYHRTRTVFY